MREGPGKLFLRLCEPRASLHGRSPRISGRAESGTFSDKIVPKHQAVINAEHAYAKLHIVECSVQLRHHGVVFIGTRLGMGLHRGKRSQQTAKFVAPTTGDQVVKLPDATRAATCIASKTGLLME
jgi:hypothetical protein